MLIDVAAWEPVEEGRTRRLPLELMALDNQMERHNKLLKKE